MTMRNMQLIATWWNKQEDETHTRLLILDPLDYLPEDLALSMQADGVTMSNFYVERGPQSWIQPDELVQFLAEKRRR